MSKDRHKAKLKGAAPCPNPLFVDWLTEWKDEAARKELKTHYTYGKALRSLKKFPLTLYSGKECKLLEGFGDKLCKMIDDRMEQHLADLGTGQSAKELIDEYRISVSSASSDRQLNHLRNQAQPKKKRKNPPQSACFGLDSGSEDENLGARTNQVQKIQDPPHLSDREKATTSARSRDYVPQKNSGAYALLIVLYRQQQGRTVGEVDSFMTKRELMTAAQPLSIKSFTVPDPGSHYTAWSSMGTLLKKELVTRRSCPAQYRITNSGSDLAHRLLLAENSLKSQSESQSESHSESHSVPPRPFCPEKRKDTSTEASRTLKKFRTMDSLVKSIPTFTRHRSAEDLVSSSIAGLPGGERRPNAGFRELSDGREENFDNGFLPDLWEEFGGGSSQDEVLRVDGGSLSKNEVSRHDSSETSGFGFVYINETGQEVVYKDEALVCIDDEISVGFLVKTKYEDLLMSGKRYKLDITKLGGGDFVFAYLADEDAPHASTSLHKSITENLTSLGESDSKGKKSTSADVRVPKTGCDAILPISSLVQPSISASFRPLENKNVCNGQKPKTVSVPVAGPSSRVFERKPSSCGSTASIVSAVQSLSGGDSQNLDSQSSAISPEDLGEPDFVFPPGTFDVVLYVDNHEYYRGTNHSDEVLIKELNRNGVNYKVCNLQIGDFLWVARQRQSDRNEESNEVVVLDYIIERKRMDDLASSIIDGRFKEQKFRLRGCGISNPIYLVEDYGSMQHFSIPEDTLNQAIINTQVIEGFFVKRTRDTKETAAYLFLMTRYLDSIYRSKSLLGYRRHFKHAKESSNGTEEKLMSFDIFNESSAKTKALTVSEMFGKHLMQLHSLTAEKATVILDLYPTPNSLFKAYQKCSNEKERNDLLANLKYGMTKRNFGKQLSKAIALLYFSSGHLP